MGKTIRGSGLRVCLRAVAVWLIAALVLLTAAAIVLSKAGTGSEVLGYVSSGISFLCAVAAGAAVTRGRGDRPFLHAILVAGILVTILLTAGFLIRDKDLDPSGILSVVTFTLTGTLVGTVLFGKKSGKKRFRRFAGVHPGKKRFP